MKSYIISTASILLSQQVLMGDAVVIQLDPVNDNDLAGNPRRSVGHSFTYSNDPFCTYRASNAFQSFAYLGFCTIIYLCQVPVQLDRFCQSVVYYVLNLGYLRDFVHLRFSTLFGQSVCILVRLRFSTLFA